MDSPSKIEVNSTASCWVEVNLAAVIHNFKQIRALVGDQVKIAAVVKADAYGHGLPETARALAEAGADLLAVTTLEEAIRVRGHQVDAPILLLNQILPSQAPNAVQLNLTPSISNLELAQTLSASAQVMNRTIRVHIKVDTGMGRFGVLPNHAADLVEKVRQLPNLEVEGIYTHFATAINKNKKATLQQFQRFRRVLADLETRGILIPIKHAANSAALVDLPQTRLDMVRPGTLLYGQYPSKWVSRSLELKPTWHFKTRFVLVKSVPRKWTISYGSEFKTKRPSRVGVIPVGYASGFSVEPASALLNLRGIRNSLLRMMKRYRVRVRIGEHSAPIIGRIAAQSCVIDLTDLPNVQIGDEITLPARRVMVPSEILRIYTY